MNLSKTTKPCLPNWYARDGFKMGVVFVVVVAVVVDDCDDDDDVSGVVLVVALKQLVPT